MAKRKKTKGQTTIYKTYAYTSPDNTIDRRIVHSGVDNNRIIFFVITPIIYQNVINPPIDIII
jgi:hypothetical protein